ncbi:unnamed protein product, partial [Hapterophycus canaliculatus]
VLTRSTAVRCVLPTQAEACVFDCTSAVEADPGRVKAYFRRALAREQLGEDGDALRDAKRVLEVQYVYRTLLDAFSRLCLQHGSW